MENLFWIGFVGAAIALCFALLQRNKVMKFSEGDDRMKEIAASIRQGANAYLARQYKTVAIVFAVVFVILLIIAFASGGRMLSRVTPFAFVTGGIWSMLAGFIGMRIATNSNARTANAAHESLNKGLNVAFSSGSVMGFTVVGLGILDITLWYFGLKYIGKFDYATIANIMVMNGMGASFMALFARVGGGIYTKAADVGADLVGKVEANIPEDDPRNPATIADNVGDNVGDVAGMGADLYESYCGSILATASLGAALGTGEGAVENALAFVLAPMLIAGIGILLSIVGIFLVRCKEGATQKNLLLALSTGTWTSTALIIIASFGVIKGLGLPLGIFGSVVAGLVAGVIIGQATEYYTSDEYKPTKGIANQANMGAATTIIDGLAVGMFSSGIPVVTICVAILAAFGLAGGFASTSQGLYGISIAAVGMLATLGITLATDAYGPIADNAGGNAEMSGMPAEVRTRTDALDSLGNTTAATGKGFAIGSAALTAMALLAAYLEEVKIWLGKLLVSAPDSACLKVVKEYFSGAGDLKTAISGIGMKDFVSMYDLSLLNPLLLCGIFIGAMMAFVFCAMTMKAVGRAAGAMVQEVRRQFKEIPGIMEGSGKPDYARCVAISTAGAQKEMLIPSLLAIIVPVVTGLVLGVAGVLGLLAGGLTAGFVLACTLNNAGGAWDNAKKFIERGNHGGKGSDAHKAAVVGDTVGDPCKDTSGPALNILIKLMSMVSVVFTPVVVKFAPVVQEWLGLIK